ncbi:tumor protein 63-like [Scleropages formosus]|uniref:tumor protein 63-like n=1 Tax=Scleropages formosus TaxID=113540 RepID=UPI000878400C|nr:tumor protein 63-like [Scleropages formosus]
MTSPYPTLQYCPEHTFQRLRDPSSRKWTESSFLTSVPQSQSSQTSDIVSQDVFNQLLEMLDQSAFHSVQPIELNFSDQPVDGSPGNTIQISMDCITMHSPDDPFALRGSNLMQHLPPS